MIERLKYIVNIVIVALLLATVAIGRDGRIAGRELLSLIGGDDEVAVEVERVLSDGTRVVNSTSLAEDVIGFAGRTPIELYIKDDVVQRVEVLPNSETPSFFDRVLQSGQIESWDGLTLADAVALEVDVVSGATYSAVAIAENVKRAAQWASEVEATEGTLFKDLSFRDIAGLLVILLGVVITFSKRKSKSLMTIQLILNVVILGFWCGSFLSLSTFVSWIGNGVNLSLGLVSFAFLCVVIVVPLFGKRGSYCHLHCPMGSAQELMGRVPFAKIKINPKVVKCLNNLRYYILIALLFMMWLGVGFDIMNYEIFSAFIVSSASTVVLVMAVVFLVLSLFIHRPYCRFVCPTGALITMTQKTPSKDL